MPHLATPYRDLDHNATLLILNLTFKLAVKDEVVPLFLIELYHESLALCIGHTLN